MMRTTSQSVRLGGWLMLGGVLGWWGLAGTALAAGTEPAEDGKGEGNSSQASGAEPGQGVADQAAKEHGAKGQSAKTQSAEKQAVEATPLLEGAAVGASTRVYNVMLYGAKGDGRSDDAPAIQAAIDEAAADGGGRVVLPPSQEPYLIRSGLKIHSSDIELYGPLATIRFADRAMKGEIIDCIEIRGEPGRPIRNVTVRGLTVDANYWNQPGSYNPRGIDSDDATNVLIDRVTITRAFVGLSFGKGVSHSEARDCLITLWHNDAYNASGDGVSGSCHDIRFVRCRAVNSPGEGQGGLPGNRNNAWEIEDGTRAVTLVDCVVADCGGNGFAVRNHGSWDEPVDGRDTTLIRCHARNVARAGFFAQSAGSRITVTGLHLEDCTSDSVVRFVKGVRDLTMVRCRFTGSVTIGPARNVEAELCQFERLTVWAQDWGEGETAFSTSVSMVDCLLPISIYGEASRVSWE